MQHRLQRFPSILRRSSGFTLIELMIALFVFAIGMLAVTAMCLMSIQSNSFVNRMTQANLLAQSKMEELLDARDVAVLISGAEANLGGAGGAGTYSRSWQVTDHNPADDTRWLAVNVSWSDAKGPHQVVLRSRWRPR